MSLQKPTHVDKYDAQRRAVIRQLHEFTVHTDSQTLLIHFAGPTGELHEYTNSGDPEVLFNKFLFVRKAPHHTYTAEGLANAPAPLVAATAKIEELEREVVGLRQQLEMTKNQLNASVAGGSQHVVMTQPPGTAPEDSAMMTVPAMEVLSGLSDPRQVRLPMWGTTIACLMVYKQILLTGMWRGQPVRIMEVMHLDLDLQDGEVYLCTQPWLFHASNGKGSQKPRHDHHTFKFQRQLPASKSSVAEGITFRKARCARRKCDCTTDAAFELVGAKLTHSTRELTLYHFRKTAINVNNIHPRQFSRSEPGSGMPHMEGEDDEGDMEDDGEDEGDEETVDDKAALAAAMQQGQMKPPGVPGGPPQ